MRTPATTLSAKVARAPREAIVAADAPARDAGAAAGAAPAPLPRGLV